MRRPDWREGLWSEGWLPLRDDRSKGAEVQRGETWRVGFKLPKEMWGRKRQDLVVSCWTEESLTGSILRVLGTLVDPWESQPVPVIPLLM